MNEMEILDLAGRIAESDRAIREEAAARLDALTKPRGSLGRLEELAKDLCAMRGRLDADLGKKCIVVMAADHGVTADGVSAFPSEVTAQMVLNFLAGGAAINVLARHAGADVTVVDMGVAGVIAPVDGLRRLSLGRGTANMTKGPAMSRTEAVLAVSHGIGIAIELIDQGHGLLGTGDMGIGNTTASAAITSAITGAPAEDVTGRGTGIDDAGLARKIEAVKKALAINAPAPSNGLDVAAKVGGFEIVGLAGVIIGAASRRVPVVIDGFISGAAALIADRIAPRSRGYMIASHQSVERGHRVILDYLGLKPVLDLDLRLGEGTGAALAFPIIEAGLKILNEMATFASAGVSSGE